MPLGSLWVNEGFYPRLSAEPLLYTYNTTGTERVDFSGPKMHQNSHIFTLHPILKAVVSPLLHGTLKCDET